jgi:DNA-binding transcriptional LysR family regulator
MELRVLRYFLTVAKEESITRAAEALHMSQPTLSRQLMDLEEQLGRKLVIRGRKKTTLTEDGMLLRIRAQEIVDLSDKTAAEFRTSDDFIAGDVWIGGGETEGMRIVAEAIYSLQQDFPHIHAHLVSGNTNDIIERLEKGLIDFGVGVGTVDPSRYDSLRLPVTHIGGLLMRSDSLLAARSAITPDDLKEIPVISPRNENMRRSFEDWMGEKFDILNVVATYNLINNAAFLVEAGVGYALCFNQRVNPLADNALRFVPYEPEIKIAGIDIAWKRHRAFSKASQKFLERLQERF